MKNPETTSNPNVKVLPAGTRYTIRIDEKVLAENAARKRSTKTAPRRLEPSVIVVSETGEVHRAIAVRIRGEVTFAEADVTGKAAASELRGATWLATTSGEVELLDE